MSDWHARTIQEVEKELDTGPDGLSAEEVERRREKYGPNRIEEEAPINVWRLLLHQFKSPLIYILIIAAVVTFAIGDYIDSAVIAFVLLLNAVLGFTQEYKAESAARALRDMVAPKARVRRDGESVEVDSEDLVPGDLVLLESGERIVADLRLARSRALEIEEAVLTGESSPVHKQADPIDEDTSVSDRTNMAFAGSTVARGRGRGYVVEIAKSTELGKIVEHVREERMPTTPLQKRVDALAKVIGIVVVVASLLAFAIGVVIGEGIAEMFKVAVALAVASVPEGLPIVYTVTLAVGVQKMARRNALVRRLPAVESLGSTTVIGSDKTGTLTENKMTVEKVWLGGEVYDKDDLPEDNKNIERLLLAGVLTNEARLTRTNGSFETTGDPTEVALLIIAYNEGITPKDARDEREVVAEIPFESERKYSASYRKVDGETWLFAKGAPETVLNFTKRMSTVDGEGDLDKDSILKAAEELAEEGLRILALAYARDRDAGDRHDPEEPEDLVFLGLVGMRDPPREGVPEAIQGCRDAGIRVMMITGDHAKTARSIGKELGIGGDDPDVLTGSELSKMDEEELKRAVKDVSIYARVSPEQKLAVVKALKSHNEIVAVTGDGVNDAPALKAADIGVAMGKSGTDVAREASDMVLADDNFRSIFEAVRHGRVTFDNLRKATFFLVSTGAAAILTILGAQALGWPLPMLPAQLLWLNLVTKGLQDIALAFEPGEAEIEKQPPRKVGEGVVSALLWERTVITGIIMAIGTLWLFRYALDATENLVYAQSVALTTMVLYQMFHVGSSRSTDRSLFRLSPVSNPFLFAAVLAALAVHILALYWGPLQFVLRTVPIDIDMWITMFLVGLTIIIPVEIHKLFRKERKQVSSVPHRE